MELLFIALIIILGLEIYDFIKDKRKNKKLKKNSTDIKEIVNKEDINNLLLGETNKNFVDYYEDIQEIRDVLSSVIQENEFLKETIKQNSKERKALNKKIVYNAEQLESYMDSVYDDYAELTQKLNYLEKRQDEMMDIVLENLNENNKRKKLKRMF